MRKIHTLPHLKPYNTTFTAPMFTTTTTLNWLRFADSLEQATKSAEEAVLREFPEAVNITTKLAEEE